MGLLDAKNRTRGIPKKMWGIISVFVLCILANCAWAVDLPEVTVYASSGGWGGGAGGAIFNSLANRTANFAIGFRNIAYVLSAFGLIMFTFMAICGKINFKHLGYITICLFFLSGTASLIGYIADADSELPRVFKNNDTYTRASNI